MKKLAILITAAIAASAMLVAAPSTQAEAKAKKPSAITVTPAVPTRGVNFTLSGTLPTKVARPVQAQYKSGKKWKKLVSGTTAATGTYALVTKTTAAKLSVRVVAKKVKIRHKTYKKVTTKTKTITTRAAALAPEPTPAPNQTPAPGQTPTPSQTPAPSPTPTTSTNPPRSSVLGTELVSAATSGSANDASTSPAISSDGRYVAFVSSASNLVDGDTNGKADIFVRDLNTGTTTRVSVAGDGSQGDGDATAPAISPDGRYVAFSSASTNLFSGDANAKADVFVRDLVAGTTTLVSVASDGTKGNDGSFLPKLSANGRYVAFSSNATNLVVGDTNDITDVFVRDLVAGTTTRVSVAGDGSQGADISTSPAMSGDGRYVAFVSRAFNLVTGDTNAKLDIFVRDRTAGTTSRISLARDNTSADNDSGSPTISADGRFVAFISSATNLVSNDTNASDDVFVRDRTTGTTTRVSVAGDGTQVTGTPERPSLSGDGRDVVFSSSASTLVDGDTNGTDDVFLRDRTAAATSRISVGSDNAQANGKSSLPAISADGRYVAFVSAASNLGTDDTNGKTDIYVRGPLSAASSTPTSAPTSGSLGIDPVTFPLTAVDLDFSYALAGVLGQAP